MTTFARPVQTGPVAGPGGSRKGSPLASWLSTTDHKIIGHLYLITSFGLFLIAGLMAVIIRAQLFGPDDHIVSDQQYNELFTMHGTIMVLLFATPLFLGLANEIMPLQIDSPDVAFPGSTSSATTSPCPPPWHNFTRIPRIRPERPAFDLHYPHIQTGRTHAPVLPGSTRPRCVSIVGSNAIENHRPASAASTCRASSGQKRRAGTACRASLLAPGK